MVLSGVSATVRPGDALLVTGRNGAGKSTLLAAIAGLVRPDTGTIRLDGAGERTIAECLHLVAHRDGLKPSLTADENLSFLRVLFGDPALSPAEALARVGLPGAAHFPVGLLSAGQRRRVALARLLIAQRPLWLLDEPTTALDTAAQADLLRMVRDHLAAGGLVVAATHAGLDLPGARELRLGEAAA